MTRRRLEVLVIPALVLPVPLMADRRGPGLVLDLRDGGRFAVTVDEPGPAAGLINDLRRRHAPG